MGVPLPFANMFTKLLKTNLLLKAISTMKRLKIRTTFIKRREPIASKMHRTNHQHFQFSSQSRGCKRVLKLGTSMRTNIGVDQLKS